MAIKKTELYSSLWQSCDELRGGMDASQYKDYILTFLFLKYVSDKYLNAPKAMVVVPEGCTFPDIIKLKGDKEVGEKLNIVLDGIAKENELPWLANKDNDFNDEDRLGKGKEMVDRLSKLIGIFEGLDFGGNSAQGDDLLGDAYEYLMRNFATESGKSKGQFYTPAEVSRILAKVVGITKDTTQDQTVYDPTCGSGSLLLKAADEARNGLSIYGQEKDVATTALCRINMILHNNADAEIAPGGHSTLAEPEFKNDNSALKTFDFAVANPPFSFKAWNTGFKPTEDCYARFEYGIPPEKNGDYAFLLHILKSLKSTGKGAVILPHGVLFRGNAEADIRRNLIKQGYIKGIIGLPANLFYGTGIPACIIVIDKAGAKQRLDNPESGIFMIDASKGFKKDGPKNRLRDQDLHKIVDVFNNQIPQSRYSRMVSFKEIEANDYNLNIPRYIDNSTPEDLHDLSAHLSGGIPSADLEALDSYWKVFPSLRRTLLTSDREGYSKALVKAAEVKSTILEHSEFKYFAETSLALFLRWKEQARVDGKFWVNNAHVMQPKSDFNIDDLTAFLESLDYSLLNSGTAQLKLNKQSCLSVKVAKPKKPEQTTIANVLSDMDKEIDALEHRLNKTQQLKQGMTQELLTGKTRLVQPKHSLPTNDRKEYVHE
jgi:type I restriction enzyme M protein